ncbi:hypothetical protein DESA109040_16255 [Deinococcus saxicola]
MFKVPKWFTNVIAPFAEMFTQPTWINAQTLLVGSILALHKRTISALLTLLGLSDDTGFARFHHFLSRAIYGESGREVEWCSGTALWYHSAKKSVYGR